MAIHKLPKDVRSAVRNGITIASTAQCVTELVLNSLDAGANSVIVHLDVPHYKLQVVDNGCGISLDNLKRVGIRYNTSKCRSLSDIQGNLKFYGYRGEALASLCESSGTVIILTRPRNEGPENSFCKTFSNGKSHHPSKSIIRRSCAGTTVTVQDFMCNAPVRQQRIKPSIDVEEIRTQVEALALSHPEVSFTIKDESDNSTVLNVTRSQNSLDIFSKLYGEEITSHLCPIGPATSGKHTLHGFISTSPHYNKKLQFIFVNGRLVKGTKLHKLINMIMRKSDVLRGIGPWQELPLPEKVRDFLWVSPTKKKDQYCVFVVNVDCPLSEYDITLDPKKTLIEFCDWDSLLECLENVVKDFLKRNNLACIATDHELRYSDEESSSSVLNEVERLDEEDVLGQKLEQFKHDNGKQTEIRMLTSRTICSMPAKRYSSSRKIGNNSKKTSPGKAENPSDKIDRNELSVKASQVESLTCNKNNCTEKPVKAKIAHGEELIKCSSLIDTNSSDFFYKSKSKNYNFCVNSLTDGYSSLGRFRNLFMQDEILPQKTPDDFQQIRMIKPPPIIKRNAPLEHRIKALRSTEQFKNTSMNTVTACSTTNMPHASSDKFLMPSVVKDCVFDKKLSKINEQAQHVLVAPLNGSECNYSRYFKKINLTTSTATQTVRDSISFQFGPDAKGVSVSHKEVIKLDLKKISSTATQNVHDSISFELRSDTEGISVSHKEIIKPNLRNLNARKECFKETLGFPNVSTSQKCDSINKDSMSVPNFKKISEYACLNFGHKSNSDISPKTQNGPSMEIVNSGFISSEDFLCARRNQMETCKNYAIKRLKNDVNLIPSQIVTDGIPKKLTHEMGNNNHLTSNTILVEEPEKNSIECDSKSATVNSPEFSSVVHQQNNFNQSKVDTSIPSEYAQIPSKQLTPPETVSSTSVLHIPSVISPEEACDGSSAYENKQKSLEKHSFKKNLPDCGINLKVATIVSNVNEDYIPAEAKNHNETLMDSPSAENEIRFKNQNCFNSSLKRLSAADDASDSIKKKQRVENLNLSNEKDIFSMLKESSSSECSVGATHFLSHYSEKSEYHHESVSGILSNVSQGASDIKNKSSSFDDINERNISYVEHCDKLDNDDTIINNQSKTEINLCQKDSQKVPQNDSDYQDERFEMFARQPFLPKGLSPIAPRYFGKFRREKGEAQGPLPSLAENEFSLTLGRKQTSDELPWPHFSGVKSGNDNAKESFISCLLSETENKKYHAESEVMSAFEGNHTKSIMKIYNLIYPCTFSKKVLPHFKMLGKLDDKFIVTQINMDKSMVSNAIVLFDQHAVHERIRLEKLMKEYQIISKEDGDSELKYIKYKSITPMPSFEISISSTESRMMESFPKPFERLGLKFEKAHGNEHSNNEIRINIIGIPACLSSKDAKELGPLGLKEQVHALIREQVENLVITRGLGTFSPGILRDAINMEACRGAVKFGDSLTYRQCRWLLRKLSTCDSPFQCAHGRPSMYPIAALSHLEKHGCENEQEIKPCIWKIRKLMESGHQVENYPIPHI